MEIKTETINCDFCHSPNSSSFDSDQEWRIVKCDSCGFCYTNPRPKIEFLPEFYTEKYYEDERFFGKFYKKDGSGNVYQVADSDQRIVDIVKFGKRNGAVLEIGAARGNFLGALKRNGWRVSGVEISESAVNFARENNGIDLFRGTYEDFDEDASFDVICMYQTLEHVASPRFVLDKAYRQLNHDGIVIIEVPNLSSFDVRINKERKRFSYDLPRHLSHFTPEFLGVELEKRGFEVVDIDLYHCNAVLKLSSFFQKRRRSRDDSNIKNIAKKCENSSDQLAELVVAKSTTANWKTKLLNFASRALPGWRFTIIARKVR